jgi:rRNA-processing protein FCF1
LQLVFDSSFLMAVSERPTDWQEGAAEALGKVEPVMLACVSAELERIASGGGSRGGLARSALEVSAKFRTEPCEGASADDAIVRYCVDHAAWAATVDGELMGRLGALGCRVLTLKGGRASPA